MPIQIACVCGKKYNVPDTAAGKRVTCKSCGKPIQIPADELEEIPDDIPLTQARSPREKEQDALARPFTNQVTFASTPGRTRVNYIRYYTCYPGLPIAAAIAIVWGLIGCWLMNYAVLISAAGAVLQMTLAVLSLRAKFISGDTNAAVVYADYPWRVAVYTNLAADGRSFCPAVRIMRAPLDRIAGGPPAIGSQLPAISLYRGVIGAPAWFSFYPTVVNTASDSKADVTRLLGRIPAEDWQSLDHYLNQLPSDHPGLYKFWPGVKNLPDLEKIQGMKAIRFIIGCSILGTIIAAVWMLATRAR